MVIFQQKCRMFWLNSFLSGLETWPKHKI
jgi:hypothetical protein